MSLSLKFLRKASLPRARSCIGKGSCYSKPCSLNLLQKDTLLRTFVTEIRYTISFKSENRMALLPIIFAFSSELNCDN